MTEPLDIVYFPERVTYDFPSKDNDVHRITIRAGTRGCVIEKRLDEDVGYPEALITILGNPVGLTMWFMEDDFVLEGETPE